MRTAKQKMIAGEPYHASDPELQAELAANAEWMVRFNAALGEPVGWQAGGIRAIQQHVSALRRQKTKQCPYQRRLAHAIAAHQADRLTATHNEIDAAQDLARTVPGDDATRLQDWRVHTPCPR